MAKQHIYRYYQYKMYVICSYHNRLTNGPGRSRVIHYRFRARERCYQLYRILNNKNWLVHVWLTIPRKGITRTMWVNVADILLFLSGQKILPCFVSGSWNLMMLTLIPGNFMSESRTSVDFFTIRSGIDKTNPSVNLTTRLDTRSLLEHKKNND